MAYSDGFLDPGSVDPSYATPEALPDPPVDPEPAPVSESYYSAPIEGSPEEYAPSETVAPVSEDYADIGENARDERLAPENVDTSSISEYEPGTGPSAPTPTEAKYEPPWQGVANFLGAAKEKVGEIASHPFFAPELQGIGGVADAAIGPYARANAGTATTDDVMEIGLDKSMSALGPIGLGAGAARRVAAKFVRQGANVLDEAGKIIAKFGSHSEAENAVTALNKSTNLEDALDAGVDTTKLPDRAASDTADAAAGRVPDGGDVSLSDDFDPAQMGRDAMTKSAARAEADAAAAGMTQTRIPGVDGSSGRYNEFEVPTQSAPQLAVNEAAEQPSLFDDVTGKGGKGAGKVKGVVESPANQPPLPVGDGPDGLPFSFANVDEVARVGDEVASDAATFNARGGVVGMVDEPIPPVRGQILPSEAVPATAADNLPSTVGRGANNEPYIGPLFEGTPNPVGAAPDINKLPGAGRSPDAVANLTKAMDDLDEMREAAAAAVSSDPFYAQQLLKRADELQKTVDEFRDALNSSVGAPVSEAGTRMYAKFTEAIISGAGGVSQKVMDWRNPEKNIGTLGKIANRAVDEVIDFPLTARAAMSTGDISLSLRHNLISFFSHNKTWGEGMDAGAQALRSTEGYYKVEKHIRSFDNFDLAKASGLEEKSIDGKVTKRMENFESTSLDDLPVVGGIVQGSTRHATAIGNYVRFKLFDNYAKAWGLADMQKAGEHDKAARLARDLASFLNTTTGNGNLGALEGAAPFLSRGFFAPRFFASRINNIAAPFVFAAQAAMPEGMKIGAKGRTLLEGGGSWQMAGLAFRDMSMYYGSVLVLAGLMGAAGAKVGTDFRSSDFLQASVGDHHIDMTGGYSTMFRNMGQIFTGERITQSGDIRDMSEKKYNEDTRLDVSMRWARGLLAPGVADFIDLLDANTTITGEPKGLMGYVPTPLGLSSIVEAFFNQTGDNPDMLDALAMTAGMGALSSLGVGVNTYKKGEKKPLRSTNPIDLWLAEQTGIGKPKSDVKKTTGSGIFRP